MRRLILLILGKLKLLVHMAMDVTPGRTVLPNASQNSNVQDIVAGIQALLGKLLDQHEREVKALRGNTESLSSPTRVQQSVPSRITADFEVESIASEGNACEPIETPANKDCEMPSWTPKSGPSIGNRGQEPVEIPDDKMCQISSFNKTEQEDDFLDSQVTPVKFSVYSVSLPNTDLPFGGDLAGQPCRVVFKGHKTSAATTRELAFQLPTSQSNLPGSVSSAQGLVVADWTAGTDVGVDCFMDVPKPCPDQFAVEVWGSGLEFPLATGTVTAGERQNVGLRGGGILDVQVTVTKPVNPVCVQY